MKHKIFKAFIDSLQPVIKWSNWTWVKTGS